jgi:hypothetical protein
MTLTEYMGFIWSMGIVTLNQAYLPLFAYASKNLVNQSFMRFVPNVSKIKDKEELN